MDINKEFEKFVEEVVLDEAYGTVKITGKVGKKFKTYLQYLQHMPGEVVFVGSKEQAMKKLKDLKSDGDLGYLMQGVNIKVGEKVKGLERGRSVGAGVPKIREEFEKFVEEFEKEWHDGHEPQGIDDQYVEEMEDGEEVEEKIDMSKAGYAGSRHKKIEKDKYNKKRKGQGIEDEVEKEASTYRDKARDDEKKKKRHFAFGGKKKSRHGSSGYGKGEEAKESKIGTGNQESKALVAAKAKLLMKQALKSNKKQSQDWWNKQAKLAGLGEDYDKNQLLRVQHDEKLISEAGDICGLDKSDLRSKSMQAVWDKKCSPETSKRKKKSIFGKSAKGLKLYNQNLKGEEKMEKLVDTVRRVLVGEDSDKEDPGTQGDMAAYQKKRKAVAKKFGVESCSALKDEKEKKACYKALDDAHVADHEEQVELEKMNKEEVAVKKKVTEGIDLKKLKKEYEDNEDKNNHTENYLLLAKAFGSKSDVKKVQEIMKRNAKEGSTSKSDMDWMYKNINPYYDKIRNEEVKVEKTISKLFSHVRKLMSK